MKGTVKSLEELEKEIQTLRREVSEIKRELEALKHAREPHRHPIEELLWQRGLPVLSHGATAQVLLPPNASLRLIERFYSSMKRYSFRLFLRDLIQSPKGANPKALTRYCSMGTVRSYLKLLEGLDIVRLHQDGSYELISSSTPSFGPTLEWYVSQIFQREFLAPSLYNVRIRNTLYGGDYDVVALLSGYLIYVEVKSSPPRGVEMQAVSAFLKRLQDLQPHVAFFLVDTELRMRDKMVPLFTEALLEYSGQGERESPVLRLFDEIFHIRHGIYLINSRKGIYTNLRRCLRDFFHRESFFKNRGDFSES